MKKINPQLLKHLIIIERTNRQGVKIYEHCGKGSLMAGLIECLFWHFAVNEDSCDKDEFEGSDSEESEVEESQENCQRKNKRKQSDPRISPFLDLSYWKK